MINSRATLIDYAFTKLGRGAINIEVTEEQANDRVDEAIQIMNEQHLAGSEKVFLRHQITSSSLLLDSSVAATFLGQNKIVGATSGATATIVNYGTVGTTLAIKGIVGTFEAGEIISAGAITATLSALPTFLSLGDTENGYITMPDSVLSVLGMLQMTNQSGNGSTNPFDLTYQLRSNDLYNLSSTSVVYYTQVQQHLALINMTLVGNKPVRFNQHQRRLHIDMDWLNYVSVGEFIMIECYAIVSYEDFTNLLNNQWLKRYTTALIKQQWGSNLSKYAEATLLGGIKLNGIKIYDQATDELDKLRDELADKWTDRASFFVG